jgi:hypothetical protein
VAPEELRVHYRARGVAQALEHLLPTEFNPVPPKKKERKSVLCTAHALTSYIRVSLDLCLRGSELNFPSVCASSF